MGTKKILFTYNGGEYIQNLKIRGTNLPWTYECSDAWIDIKPGATSLTIKVGTIYDFNSRVGTIKIFDRFKNEIDLVIEQTGYYDLSVEMPNNIILYQGYYDENGEFIATEGEDAEALENGENTESTDNAGGQETGNSNG